MSDMQADSRGTFLLDDEARQIAAEHGTPIYVYSERAIRDGAAHLAGMPSAFGLRPRFAMKACPSAAVLQLLTAAGLGIDASSGFEAERALRIGIAPKDISLTAQELPANLPELLARGIDINACSMAQLHAVGEALRSLPAAPKTTGIRFNPGLGSGHSSRTNVGGPSSGFGIWSERLPEAKRTAADLGLTITRVHSHIGSGTDPAVWERCARMTLELALAIPDVTTVSLGGGFKVARMPGDPETDLSETGARIAEEFRRVQREHGRRFLLEVEPGAYLMAKAGAIVSSVIDLVDTGEDGYRFVKLDTGMTEIIRPAMYGASHPLVIVPRSKDMAPRRAGTFLVIGHCCESGDILTPEPGNPEGLRPRQLPEPQRGDLVIVGATGAYTSGFSAANYNSFPLAAEVLLRIDGSLRLIRKRQTLEQIIANEIPLEGVDRT